MAAVIEALGGVVEYVSYPSRESKGFFGDFFDAVGDVFQSVGNFIEKAVNTVATVIENIVKDPLPTIVALAGQAVGIPYPVTMGVVTAARGGDLEDVILSVGASAVGGYVAGPISGTLSSTFVDAGLNAGVSNALGSSISSGLINGTIAEVKGGDFEKGFAGGFTGGMVSAGVGEVASYVKPEVMEFAQESGIDLQTAGDIFNAGTKAFGSGVSAEIRGGDFSTAFTNSAIGSSIDVGTRSINRSIDEQFKTTVTQWDEKDPDSKPIEFSTDGAGIPTSLKDEVPVSEIGFESNSDVGNQTVDTATSDVEILPNVAAKVDAQVEAPVAETTSDFADIAVSPEDNEPDIASYFPESVSDIAASVAPETASEVTSEVAPEVKPEGALTALAAQQETPVEPAAPISPIVEAPVINNLVTTGLAPEAPVGGLNAVAPKSQEDKMAEAQGLKVTDFTKPMISTFGNLLKSSLTQTKKPVARPAPPAPLVRPAPPVRPVGALAAASKPKVAPPKVMDVSKLIPIQRAQTTPQAVAPLAQKAPPRVLPSSAKLTPIKNIAGLSSMLRKTA
jgi:hypothetical protein